MFSFLRKIRYNILKENKFFRYLKYAIGEIVLVVIGILIAVAINSRYNEAQDEEKIKRILFQIQRELLTDIQDSKRIYNEYIAKDSIYRMIMNDTSLVYLHQQSPYSFQINSNYVSFSNKKAGYNRLLSNIEVMPKKYNALVPKLNYLHVELQNDIDDYNEMIKNAVLSYFKYQNDTNPNFSEILWSANVEETIEYYQNDPFFKNKISHYMNALRNVQQAVNDYRIESISIHKAIDSLTGNTFENDNVLLKVIPPDNRHKAFLGEYTDGEKMVTLRLEDERLYLDAEPLYWHKDNYYYNWNSLNIIRLSNTNEGYVIQIDNTNTSITLRKTTSQ